MHRAWKTGLFLVVCVGAAASIAPRAEACGGCFAPPGPSTEVTAHRMAFVVTTARTILWDQIEYVGDPSSFGWVLPIRSAVDVGVSSDELFRRLDGETQPIVTPPPPPTCPPPEKRCRTTCGYGAPGADSSASFDTAPTDAAVDVWSSAVVGPYEATQLSASDGTALRTWLTDHGYVLPDAIAPVIDAYVSEGFGFLAVKLVPGLGTSRMVPIRIAFDGASPSLPLRMVAAGTGANVGIKLFVLGDGRWEAQNFDNAEIATSSLVWNWAVGGSNLGQLETDLIGAHPAGVWIAQSSQTYSLSDFFDALPPPDPGPSADGGDGGDGSVFVPVDDKTEIEKAFPGKTSATVTRLFAQLPVAALGTDLELQASLGGTIPVSREAPTGINFYCGSSVEYVDCPGVSPTCDSGVSHYDSGVSHGDGGYVETGPGTANADGETSDSGGSGCGAAQSTGSSLTFVGGVFAVMLGLGALRRRRR
jgi:hypothetical protein